MNEKELKSSVRCIIDTWEAEVIIEAISKDLASVFGIPCQYESIDKSWCEESEPWECWREYLVHKIVK